MARIGNQLAPAGALIVLAGMLSAGPALAAPACHAGTCNGRNPVATGCASDAVTLASRTWSDHAAGGTFGQHTVELRYSHRCDASWARVRTSAGGTAGVTRVDAWLRGHRAVTVRHRNSAGTVFSLMLSGEHRIAAGTSNFNHGAVIKTTYVAP